METLLGKALGWVEALLSTAAMGCSSRYQVLREALPPTEPATYTEPQPYDHVSRPPEFALG